MAQQQKKPYFMDKKILITGASSGIGEACAYW
jgi:NADP-dependent 3-hydroxy acid dehydrogenase YdfG